MALAAVLQRQRALGVDHIAGTTDMLDGGGWGGGYGRGGGRGRGGRGGGRFDRGGRSGRGGRFDGYGRGDAYGRGGFAGRGRGQWQQEQQGRGPGGRGPIMGRGPRPRSPTLLEKLLATERRWADGFSQCVLGEHSIMLDAKRLW